ncbi:unnamed protein product [Somion occarium]|uniref:Uncharacterized protein n=1 Tax=Somion occarium TaxID=3059160 RepID=A0ABP1CM10_9APHY
MAPKPRPRKPSTASKEAATLPKTQNAQSMPPPPDPPQGILVPEIAALSTCVQNMAVKTGQIYGFFADAQRLGIHKHAPNPPCSLMASLGREVEKYDQLCDALELHLTRAISVLKRDLTQEQERIREEERVKVEAAAKEAASNAAEAAANPSTAPSQVPVSPTSTMELQISSTERKPVAPARRASTISLSSLHRPPFPHKLDLSSIAFNPEDAHPLQSGPASPVTLAPKSSIPRSSMPPPDLLSVGGQAVDIDLTLDDGDVAMAMSNPGMPPSHVGSNSHPSEPQMSDIFNVLQTTPEPNATTTGTSGGMSSGDFSGMEQMFPSGTSSSLDMGAI